jgi:hypothetical protein
MNDDFLACVVRLRCAMCASTLLSLPARHQARSASFQGPSGQHFSHQNPFQ